MKKIKIKRILLLFSLTIAMIGCFFVKSSSVKASDDLIFSVDTVGYSDKSNIVYTEYSKVLDKVVCVTNNSTICFLDYKTMEYSEEIAIEGIPTNTFEYYSCLCGDYLITVYYDSSNEKLAFLKINLFTYETTIHLSLSVTSSYSFSIHAKNDEEFYLSTYKSDYYIYVFNLDSMTYIKSFSINNSNGNFISYADDDYISMSSYYGRYNGNIFRLSDNKIIGSNPCSRKGYKIDGYIYYAPMNYYGEKTSYNFKYFDIFNQVNITTSYKSNYNKGDYSSFCVDNKIYILPIKTVGYIEAFTINDFQLEGDNILFTDINSPLSYQNILSQYTPSDKYGRSLMTSVKADSYYNSFSTPGNYDATITVSDGYCHEDFAITIVVNKGGGEEEKKESSGSSIKWDTNLMIQSFGGIAVFLVLGLLVVSIIKKILR